MYIPFKRDPATVNQYKDWYNNQEEHKKSDLPLYAVHFLLCQNISHLFWKRKYTVIRITIFSIYTTHCLCWQTNSLSRDRGPKSRAGHSNVWNKVSIKMVMFTGLYKYLTDNRVWLRTLNTFMCIMASPCSWGYPQCPRTASSSSSLWSLSSSSSSSSSFYSSYDTFMLN